MTLSELPGAAWKARLPQLESLWRRALPTFRPVRFAKVVILPMVFAVATCFVPLRNINDPVVKGAVAQQTMQRLEELMQQLEEADVIKPEEKESEQLKEEMQKLSQETKERPLTHEKWETVDALQERLKAKLEHQANLMSQAADSLAVAVGPVDALNGVLINSMVFAFVPIDLIAVKHTTTISDSMTAYSTAVGPSSDLRNRRTFCNKVFIPVPHVLTGFRRAHPLRRQRGGDVGKGRVGVRADRLDGRQAHDHDEGQHHGIFNRGGAIFRLQKTTQLQDQILHGDLRFRERLRGPRAERIKLSE